MLERLAIHDKKWRDIAYRICGCRFQADDIVQDMYIKMSSIEYSERKLRTGYITSVMFNGFIENIKISKRRPSKVELIDNYISVVDDMDIVFDDYDLEILKKCNGLSFDDRRLLIDSYNYSLRKNSEVNDIGLNILFRRLKQARKEVLGSDYEKKYRNKRVKYQR